MASEFARWFVNRRDYVVQSARSDPVSGRHGYYRPGSEDYPTKLALCDIQRDLADELTLRANAINPVTQRVKWIAADGDMTTRSTIC
jgi:hypothetical protein